MVIVLFNYNVSLHQLSSEAKVFIIIIIISIIIFILILIIVIIIIIIIIIIMLTVYAYSSLTYYKLFIISDWYVLTHGYEQDDRFYVVLFHQNILRV